MRKFVYQACYTRYQVSCYLCQIRPGQNTVKFENIVRRVFWKFSFFSLTLLTRFIFCIKDRRNALKLEKMSINWSLKKAWPSYNPKFSCHEKYFLTAIEKILFLDGTLGTRLCLQHNLRFFWYFLISSGPKS